MNINQETEVSSNKDKQSNHSNDFQKDKAKQSSQSQHSRDKHFLHPHHTHQQKGGLFQPEVVNNAFNLKDSLLNNEQEDDGQVRNEESDENRPAINIITDKTPIPIDEADETIENITETTPSKQTNGKLIPPPLNEPHTVNLELRDSSTLPTTPQHTDSSTWLRRFSVKPFNMSTPDTYKWNEFKKAFKFTKGKKEVTPQHPQIVITDEEKHSNEQARMRASNLITTFISGAPAALIGMTSLKVDEHGVRRAPLLPSLIGLELEDVTVEHMTRHRKFLLKLEYGVGPNRLKWSVLKDSRDFSVLNTRLKVALFQSKQFKGEKNIDLPKLPKEKKIEDVKTTLNHPSTLNDQYLSVKSPRKPNLETLSHPPIPLQRNRTAGSNSSSVSSNSSHHMRDRFTRALSIVSTMLNDSDQEESHELYTRKLESYLKQLMRVLSLRPESNRLFQFLELSPIGVLLSYEQGYQGKQGYLIVSSTAKAQGWRVSHLKVSDFTQMVKRHTNKWFLVRGSYLLYVSDIYSTTPLDVFLVDSHTAIQYNVGSDEKSNNNDNVSLYDDGYSIDDDDELKISKSNAIQTHYSIKLENGERSLKLLARSENQAKLWIQSIEIMMKNTIWTKYHRFNSFAPARDNCFAQWFVDGRDYFWAVSSAMEMAKDVIYIHDWWLTPELYMRRPANGNQEFRLDRILKRKAEQGVKIFVVIYRNVASTVITDSLWTKHSLIDLHPSIHVLRSPNQWLQNTYFWAHHEKLCIIDHTVAFIGGVDLCYGRYDTPDHVLVDDSPHDFATKQNATEESIKYQKFPGKDYSNPRVKDFYNLDNPYESMYDRDVVPRMPWHDVHMMTAGQAAGDAARHFVQRWNYLLRQKRPSRPTPLLTPPSEFNEFDLERFGLTGNSEVQLLRSAGNWSLGLKKVEKSIQEAYLKLIETSQYFVYIENQFFITSTSVDGTVIDNRIGDALVDRIIRANANGEKWKAVIVIPLMPGFESQVDEAEGSAVRVIMQCQYKSISRGEASIFGKLKKMKINPYDYIQFFSLRKWGRIGPDRKIVSEQLYIHSKILLVDDTTALIGSANINERSQRGNRDSEVAVIVRDKEVVNTTMNGVPYKAGKFCHTLRMRLMREHLGVDVDILEIVEKRFNKLEELAKTTKTGFDSKTNDFINKDFNIRSSMVELASRDVLNMPHGTKKWKNFKIVKNLDTEIDPKDEEYYEKNESDSKDDLPVFLKEKSHQPLNLFYHSFNNRAREENTGIRDNKAFSSDSRLVNNQEHKRDVAGQGNDKMDTKEFKNYKVDAAKTLKKWAKNSLVNESNDIFLPNIEQVLEFLEDDEFIADPNQLTNQEEIILHERNNERWELLKRIAYLQRVAAKQKIQNKEENFKRSKIGLPNIFLNVFNEKEKNNNELNVDQVTSASSSSPIHEILSNNIEVEDLPGDNIPVISLDNENFDNLLESFDKLTGDNFNKFIDPYSFSDPLIDTFYEDIWFQNAVRNTLIFREVFHCQPDDSVVTWKQYKDFSKLSEAFNIAQDQEISRRESIIKPISSTITEEYEPPTSIRVGDIEEGILGKAPPTESEGNASSAHKNRRGINALKGSVLGSERVFDRETADKLLSEVQGHLVVFPCDWLSKEIESGNWFYNMDRLPPIEIYD